MQSAKVIESIVDLSGRIGTEEGIYAYIALPGAKKGPLGKPYFITNVDELLENAIPFFVLPRIFLFQVQKLFLNYRVL